jgi:hypothetical protein
MDTCAESLGMTTPTRTLSPIQRCLCILAVSTVGIPQKRRWNQMIMQKASAELRAYISQQATIDTNLNI